MGGGMPKFNGVGCRGHWMTMTLNYDYRFVLTHYIYIYVYIFISKYIYIYILCMYIYIYIERGNLYIHNLLITSKHLPLLLLFRPFLVSMKILHFPENPWRCSQRWLDLERVLQEPSWERSHGTHQAGSWDNHRPKSAAVCRGLC